GKLRSELKYNGVVITDALAMGAISKNYKSGYASVKAIQAGADIVLMPNNLAESYNAVLKSVKANQITAKELNTHVLRILNLKENYGLL
ncbi:MAG: glycoside hydrolase family 3 protein, partial [Ruminococcus sp.]|nr:glycoside hydrolase family 3 protein [Ruminococcus sp.]